jgi:hypothetical protein
MQILNVSYQCYALGIYDAFYRQGVLKVPLHKAYEFTSLITGTFSTHCMLDIICGALYVVHILCYVSV